MDIADFMTQKIKDLGINQSEFARRTGLTSGPVSKWMSRGGMPDLESCLKIAAFFKEDPVVIFRLAGREDLVALHRKFHPDFVRVNVSEEDLYQDETHRELHRGLQRVLERGMERKDDVHLGVELLRRSLDALLRSEALFRSLVETANVIPWEASAESLRFTYVGPQAERILDYPIEEWYQPEFWENHLHPADRESALRHRQEYAGNGAAANLEYRMIGRDGRIVWFQDFGDAVQYPAGPPTRRGFMFDITPRKEAEDALKDSEQRYRSLVELCPDAIIVHREGLMLYVNPASVKLHGAVSGQDLVGRSIFEFVHPAHVEKVRERIRLNMEEGKAFSLVEQKIVPLDGEPIWVEVAAAPIIYQGKPAIQSILRETSHRRIPSEMHQEDVLSNPHS